MYEWVICLGREVPQIWSLKWKLPKVVFLINCYILRALLICLWIVDILPGTNKDYRTNEILPLLAILVAQVLILIRVLVIYDNSERMLWCLTFLYASEVVVVVICISVTVIYTEGQPGTCVFVARGDSLQKYGSGIWGAPICFEVIIFLVTLAKVIPILRSRRSPTMKILARDSIVYFALIFSFTLADAIVYGLESTRYYRSILLGPTSAIPSKVSRMMLNMRSACESPISLDLSSEIRFASDPVDLEE
ncbi:hypothetical protein B0H13DRAFT_2303982 [Mycena leptocephala]|nr:hypothetical protein B0H13DRAFT_2303982 [Mycena leptocephala]